MIEAQSAIQALYFTLTKGLNCFKGLALGICTRVGRNNVKDINWEFNVNPNFKLDNARLCTQSRCRQDSSVTLSMQYNF